MTRYTRLINVCFSDLVSRRKSSIECKVLIELDLQLLKLPDTASWTQIQQEVMCIQTCAGQSPRVLGGEGDSVLCPYAWSGHPASMSCLS